MNKIYRSIWNAASGTYVAAPEKTKAKGRKGGSAVLAAGVVAAALASGSASAQVVTACTGVSLPQSVVTDIVGQAVLPVTGILDTALGPLTGLLGLSTNLTNTLTSIASGAPITLSVLDTNGNVVSPNAPCPTAASDFSLTDPKGISIGGNHITGLGGPDDPANYASAGEMNSIAFGNRAVTDVAAANSIAIGPDATIGANGTNSVALGSAANANVANSVALGAGSAATVGAQAGYTAFGLTAPQTSVGEVSIGSAGNTRKITNLAAGSAATDAVNVAQLQAVDNGAVKYDDPVLKTSVTLGGTGGTQIHNLAAGTAPTDAANVSQLQGVSGNMDALGLSMAANLGGGAVYNPLTGTVSAPTYVVYGSPQTNVGAAIAALQTGAPIQYSNGAGVATPGTPSNDVTLVGSAPGPVTVHNVATPTAGTDAANKAYVDSAVSQGTANSVTYDSGAKDKVTLAGPTSTDGGATGGTTITNVHQGELSPTSTDAVNGSQLYATNQQINNIQNGGGIKYFHADPNSTKADSQATGADSVAMGPAAVASGVSSVAAGDGATASGANSVAIGRNAQSTGTNTVAIGNGAVARNSVAVGAGAQADNGGAAFGDNAVAMTAQQGTAIGNGATVTADRGVALGAGATATRAGMNGTTEKYSNVAVASTEGAVSVGSAGNERQITNVAGGTAPTDAVNVRQLDSAVTQANNYTDYRINGLQTNIDDVRKDARAGSASAMAMAGMPQSTLPGKSMLAAGMSTYQGQSALAVGVSTLSDNGRWVMKINGTTNTRGDVGAAVGAGFHW